MAVGAVPSGHRSAPHSVPSLHSAPSLGASRRRPVSGPRPDAAGRRSWSSTRGYQRDALSIVVVNFNALFRRLDAQWRAGGPAAADRRPAAKAVIRTVRPALLHTRALARCFYSRPAGMPAPGPSPPLLTRCEGLPGDPFPPPPPPNPPPPAESSLCSAAAPPAPRSLPRLRRTGGARAGFRPIGVEPLRFDHRIGGGVGPWRHRSFVGTVDGGRAGRDE